MLLSCEGPGYRIRSVTASKIPNCHYITLCAIVGVFEQPLTWTHETCPAIQKRSVQPYIAEDNTAEQKHSLALPISAFVTVDL
jgi:hypothetical protein